MRNANGQRLPLKSKLLVGAAGMAAAAMSSAAFADDATPVAAATPAPTPSAAPAATPAQASPSDLVKWHPYVDLGGGFGTGFTDGHITAFVPVWQDLDSLMFVRLGEDSRTKYGQNFNAGIGYRTKIDNEWILGIFGGYDSTHSVYDHAFDQWSLGVEAMNEDWDARINGYLADDKNRAIGNKSHFFFDGTSIAFLQAQEAGMSGFDGEIGYRIFNTDSSDVRVFAGGYVFHHDAVDITSTGVGFHTPYDNLNGEKIRAEYNIFDLDELGPQSRLQLEAEVSHDGVHNLSGYVGATLRIAIGDTSGGGAQALDELDRRMIDPVRRRDNVLTQWKFNKPEPVIIYNGAITSQPTNTVFYAEQRASAGTGSYANQTTIQDATARGDSGRNAFIVLTDKGGATIDATGTHVLTGETVTGAGTFNVRGIFSGAHVSHDFAPGSGPVTLTGTGNVITLDPNTVLNGFSISGGFTNAIYGYNVSDVVITNMNIDGGGVGKNGIVINQVNAPGTSNITISNTTITGVTNDGVDLTTTNNNGATSATNLTISNSSISAGHDGVNLVSTTSATGTDSTVYVGIHDSTITAGGVATAATGTAGAGSSLTQTLLVDPTTLSGGTYGVLVNGTANGGTLNQTVSISDVTISDESLGGIVINATGNHSGTVNQTVSLNGVTIGATYSPLLFNASGDNGAHVTQTVTGGNVAVGVGYYDNIDIYASASNGAVVSQAVTLSHVTSINAPGDNVYVSNTADTGATSLQNVSLNYLTATGAGFANVEESQYATGAGTVAAQYLTIDHASLDDGGVLGVGAHAYSGDAAISRQDLSVSNATITGSGGDGVRVYGYATGGASVQQNVNLYYDTITHNAGTGVSIENRADGDLSFATQAGTIGYVDASYNGDDGFHFVTSAYQGDTEQDFVLYNVTADHETSNGLHIEATSSGYLAGGYTLYPSHVEQDIVAEYADFSHNGEYGVQIEQTAVNNAGLDSSFYLYDVHADHNADSGVLLETEAVGHTGTAYTGAVPETHLYASLYFTGSTADHNGRDGVTIYTASIYDALQRDHVTIAGSDMSYNAYNGLTHSAFATGYHSFDLAYVTIAGSTFTHNAGNGAAIYAKSVYGFGTYGAAGQIVTISGSDFSHNGANGLYFGADASGPNGRAEQYGYIYSSTFTDNGANGLEISQHAHDGYYTGVPCYEHQGTTGGCAVVRGEFRVDGSTFSDNANSGIYLRSYSSNYGDIYSSVSGAPTLYISNSTISGNAYAGIAVANKVKYDSYQGQTIILDNTKVTGNGTDGTYFNAFDPFFFNNPGTKYLPQGGIISETLVTDGSSQRQTLVLQDGTSVSDNHGFGVALTTFADNDYFVYSNLFAYDSTVGGNNGGVLMDMFGGNTYFAIQQFKAEGSTFSDNLAIVNPSPKYNGDGVTMLQFVNGANVAYQYFGAIDSVFSGNYGNGAQVRQKYSQNIGTNGQVVYLSGSTFSGNGYNGLRVGQSVQNVNHAYQTVTNANSTFSGNDGVGLDVNQDVSYSNLVEQTVSSTGSTFTGNTDGAGLYVRQRVAYAYVVTQTVSSTDDKFSANQYGGLGVYQHVETDGGATSYGPLYYYSATQKVTLTGDTFDSTTLGETGAYIHSYVGGSVGNQLVYVYKDSAGVGNSFTGSDRSGLYVGSYFDYAGTGKLMVDGASFTNNDTGLVLYTEGDGNQLDVQVGIYNSTFTGNHTGIYLHANYGYQHGSIQHNTFTANSDYGIYAYGQNGSYQKINAIPNTFSGNGQDVGFDYDGSSSANITY